MLSHLHPALSQLPPSIRGVLDLFTGFALVYALRCLSTAFSRWRLIRSHSGEPPVLHLRDVPGPNPPSWLWGSEWEMYNSDPGQKYLEWYDRFGRIVKFKGVLGSSFLSLADPSAIQYILGHQHCYEFPKPDGERQFFLTLLGKGLIWAEGEAHLRQRRILSPGFSQEALRALSPIFIDSANKTAQAWNTILESASGDNAVIDVQRWANHISLDTIGLAGFAYDFQTLDPSKAQHPLARTLDGLTDSSGTHSFSAFLVHAFLWAFPAILRIPSKRQQALARSRQMLGKITDQVWEETKQVGQDSQDTGGKSIMELLLRAERPGAANTLSQQEIAAEMMTLIFAGYETTATVIAWALHELALNPTHQDALRDEVSALGSEPTFDELHSGLPFLDAVINETLRIHPVVLQVHREASQDSLVPLTPPPKSSYQQSRGLSPDRSAHLFIPRGTIILFPVNVMQTAEDVWGPDAHTWNPRRWADIERKEAGEKRKDWRRELLVFSTGARGCIGRRFSVLEMKAVLATLVRQFVFSPAEEIEPLLSFVVRPRVKGAHKSSLPLTVRKVVL
ncbi:cytochrome P450 [Gautieria morchelliformis]|nr:cytochrome P450 [Gautieria morchelliformis]